MARIPFVTPDDVHKSESWICVLAQGVKVSDPEHWAGRVADGSPGWAFPTRQDTISHLDNVIYYSSTVTIQLTLSFQFSRIWSSMGTASVALPGSA